MSAANPVVCAVNSVTRVAANAAHSFFAVTAGTITITRSNSAVVLNAYPVTAGQWVELEMNVDPNGWTLTTAGGASGTVTVY